MRIPFFRCRKTPPPPSSPLDILAWMQARATAGEVVVIYSPDTPHEGQFAVQVGSIGAQGASVPEAAVRLREVLDAREERRRGRR